nr:hypothetical protein [Streptomyces sp. GESEQ-35]
MSPAIVSGCVTSDRWPESTSMVVAFMRRARLPVQELEAARGDDPGVDRRGGEPRRERGEVLAGFRGTGGYVDESGDVRAEPGLGDDRAAIGVSDQDRGPLLARTVEQIHTTRVRQTWFAGRLVHDGSSAD